MVMSQIVTYHTHKCREIDKDIVIDHRLLYCLQSL